MDLTARFLNLVPPGQETDFETETLPRDPIRPAIPLQRQVRLGEQQLLELIASYLNGATVASLARRYGINQSTLHAQLNRRSVPRHPYRKLTPSHIEEARRLRGDGWTITALAEQFGVARRTVQRVL